MPVTQLTLDNGLRVVLSRDATTPIVMVGVYYGIGFRIEPRDRTGFAHLFEHMMFQGSQNLGKGEFDRLIEGNGGFSNGSTRFDFTNYFEVVPSHALETMLWGEADRMRGLALTQAKLTNQQGVVKSEVRVNVINQPYGGFPWLDMPQYANKNWFNAHNFYGDLADLDRASLADVKSFFGKYYAPNNAVLVLVGDFDEATAEQWVRKYFAPIKRGPEIARPDISEPPQDKELRVEKLDKLADKPALAIGYHAPERMTPEFFAFVLLDEILLQGHDSALFQKLVQDKQLTGDISGSVNFLGNAYNFQGPMLWTAAALHDREQAPDKLIAAFDEAIAPVRQAQVSAAVLARAKVKARARLYDILDQSYGFGRADLLATFALFDGDAKRLNTLEDALMQVTAAQVLDTAKKYLAPTNRTILMIKPGKQDAPAPKQGGAK